MTCLPRWGIEPLSASSFEMKEGSSVILYAVLSANSAAISDVNIWTLDLHTLRAFGTELDVFVPIQLFRSDHMTLQEHWTVQLQLLTGGTDLNLSNLVLGIELGSS